MATVEDLAGNNPIVLDPAVRRTDKVSAVEFQGLSQSVTIGAGNNTSSAFGNRTRFLRIAPDADIYYDIDFAPDATVAAQRSYLVADAVETLPVQPGQKIDITQVGASSGTCVITEDKA